MTKLEMKLQIIFHNATSTAGDRAGLDSLYALEKQAVTIEESDIIKDCLDFLFVRGNLRILEERL